MPGWSRSRTEGQSLPVWLYTTVLWSKSEASYFFPMSHLVFSAEKQHSPRTQKGTPSGFGKLKASLSQSVTSGPAVLWLSNSSCLRGLLKHPLPTELLNPYSVSRGMRSCWVPGRKHFWKAKTTPQLLKPSLSIRRGARMAQWGKGSAPQRQKFILVSFVKKQNIF